MNAHDLTYLKKGRLTCLEGEEVFHDPCKRNRSFHLENDFKLREHEDEDFK